MTIGSKWKFLISIKGQCLGQWELVPAGASEGNFPIFISIYINILLVNVLWAPMLGVYMYYSKQEHVGVCLRTACWHSVEFT